MLLDSIERFFFPFHFSNTLPDDKTINKPMCLCEPSGRILPACSAHSMSVNATYLGIDAEGKLIHFHKVHTIQIYETLVNGRKL